VLRNLTPDRSVTWGAVAGAVVIMVSETVKAVWGVVLSESWVASAVLVVNVLVTHFVPNSPRQEWTEEQRAALRKDKE
jgi:hypothetical protein